MSRTDKADELINEQIEKELDKLEDFMTREEDKPAIIARVAELRKLLVVEAPVQERPAYPRPGERPESVTPAAERLRAPHRPQQSDSAESLRDHAIEYVAGKIKKFF